MKALFRMLYIVLGILMAGVIILLVGSMIPVAGFQTRIVTSGSMEPAIKTGSIVIVRPSEVYEDGDIITFYERGKEELPTTHRIIGSELAEGRLQFITQGDANKDPDQRPVSADQVVGRVVAVAPGFGYVLAFARTWYGLLLLVGLPFLLVVVEEASNIKKAVAEADHEK